MAALPLLALLAPLHVPAATAASAVGWVYFADPEPPDWERVDFEALDVLVVGPLGLQHCGDTPELQRSFPWRPRFHCGGFGVAAPRMSRVAASSRGADICGWEWLCSDACPGIALQPCARCCDLRLEGACGREECCDPVALGRRGVAAYRIFLASEVALLHFRGCGIRCAVYADRVQVAEHEGSYSPFWVDLTDFTVASGPKRELLVLADNRFSRSAKPHFDWLQQGGLLRPVEAHVLQQPPLRIVALAVQLDLGGVKVSLKLSQSCRGLGERRIRLRLGAAEWVERRVQVEDQWLEPVGGLALWSLGAPALHTATAWLYGSGAQEPLDGIAVRFGLRRVEAKRGQVLINGEPVRLLGVNRHESHPLGGIYLSQQQLQEDVQLLKELGANFVRGAHYSQDQRFLDLCDEAGILFWEETAAWQPSLEDLQDPEFMAQQAQALEETIGASINHPSVIIWGFLNEGAADTPAARPAYARLAALARALDPLRLVAWASRHKTRDVTLDLADLIAFNDYPGWYDSSVLEIPSTWLKYAEWARASHPGKPLLLAEAGAGGLAGWRTGGEEMWSEDLQAAITGATVAAALAAGFAGIALWQFADSRVDLALFEQETGLWPEAAPLVNVSVQAGWMEQLAVGYQTTNGLLGRALRPRGLNNKGLVSISRQHRKLAFYAAQEAFLPSSSLPLFGLLPAETELCELRAVGGGCAGCALAVHTWNAADRPLGELGLRAHGHRAKGRAGRWTLQRGLMRLAGDA
ncbi:unnamed protein product [Effrenium voratum]|uniref:Glycoside hydrolase family 2 catalytic domain-containing protein n=1 Tax=Effrenium voratum TaxID=2562239 RepID=A0AA36HL19_9DINO|nr:unnamed protein product [Effrenium voratum]